MKAIVVGADSTIGRALMAALDRRGDVVYGTTRRPGASERGRLPLDLGDRNIAAARLPDAEITFFCAALTGFRDCRENPELARMVNATSPVALARRLVEAGSRVVLISTSAVFDWGMPHVPPSRPPCPVTVYGKHKAEAEAGFLSLGRNASVVRFGKVLEPGFKLFNGWIEALRAGKPVQAFSDLRMAPVSLDDALTVLLAMANHADGGIYQFSGATDISYFEAGRHLAKRLDRDADLVTEARAIDAGIPIEEITRFSSLDTTRVTELTGRAAPDPYAVMDATFGLR